MTTEVEHKHKWTMSTHLDGCHWYTSIYVCKCRASANITTERNPLADPYSMVWMEPTYREVTRDDKGRFLPKDQRRFEEETCVRCKELQAGAPVKQRIVVYDKDGKLESDKEFTRDQDQEDDAGPEAAR